MAGSDGGIVTWCRSRRSTTRGRRSATRGRRCATRGRRTATRSAEARQIWAPEAGRGKQEQLAGITGT